MYRNVYLFSKQPFQQKVRVGDVRNQLQAARGRHCDVGRSTTVVSGAHISANVCEFPVVLLS